MFCMLSMIKKIILEGFNDRGGAIERGKRRKHFKNTKNNKKNIKTEMYFGFFSTYTENPPYFACRDFFTCSIDLEWSQGLGSLKMKV